MAKIAEELLQQEEILSMRARGLSMAPFIKDGDVVQVVRVREDGIKTGDLLIFRCLLGLVCHRVIKRKRDDSGIRYVTKGDSSAAYDAPIKPEQIVGKVTAVTRNGKQVYHCSPFYRISGMLFFFYNLCIEKVKMLLVSRLVRSIAGH